ncbi:MAG: methyltransferase domain-containing protein [Actinomycetota bacterium]
MPAAPSMAQVYEDMVVPGIFGQWSEDLVERAEVRLGDHVLDVACGTGAITRLLPARVGPTGRVVGLDVSPPMLAVARSVGTAAGLPIEWHEGDAMALPFGDAEFDAVLCQQGLQFFPDPPAGVREMRRVLRPGGRAVVSCWRSIEEDPAFGALDDAAARHLGRRVFTTRHALSDADMLRSFFTDAGFRDVTVEPRERTARIRRSPREFARLSMEGAASAVPELKGLDPPALARLLDELAGDAETILARFVRDDVVEFPQTANIARGVA